MDKEQPTMSEAPAAGKRQLSDVAVQEEVEDAAKRAKVDDVEPSPSSAAPARDAAADSDKEPSSTVAKSSESPARPFSGGFGDLATKGGSGFAFGGTSSFGNLFQGTQVFGGSTGVSGGTFGSVGAFNSKDSAGNGAAASVPVFGTPQTNATESTQVFGSSMNSSGTTQLEHFSYMYSAKSPSELDAAEKAKHETGEEGEVVLFESKASLYFLDRSSAQPTWKERGVGFVRINLTASGKSRLVMRQKGILRLLLNAYLYPEMTLQRMEGRPRVSFMCANAAASATASEPSKPADGEQATRDAESTDAAASEVRGAEAPEPSSKGGHGSPSAAPTMGLYALKMGNMETLEQFVSVVDKYKHAQEVLDVEAKGHMDVLGALAAQVTA